MKINKLFIAMAAAGLLFATSCVKDLDTLPLNEEDSTSETAYGADESGYLSGLTKLYFNFANTTGLDVSDGGASELVRAFWSIQEVTTDACKCAWGNDAWVRAMNTNTWSAADNAATYAVYARTQQGIAYINEFMRQTTPDKLSDRGVDAALAAKIDAFRAEARFLRAYLYWIALDVFGDVPFTTEASTFGENPAQKSRAEVFQFCIDELTELVGAESAMPAPRSNYPRADKGSVTGLLARMYLNAEVYTGTAMWAEAKAACESIFSMGYVLAPEYADLFRGDNGENPDARNEMLFAVAYDAEQTQSFGGTSYLTRAALAATDAVVNGTQSGCWAGIRVSHEFVSEYFDVQNPNYTTGAYTVADKRGAMFYITGRTEIFNTEEQLYTFLNGWSCIKFNNVPHDQTWEEFAPTAATKAYSDIDFPMIRLGEIYLIYAEACMHAGGNATSHIAQLSTRAGVAAPATIDQEWLVAERARELMWESHRRTDLIRYGLFTGSALMWPFKGGNPTGQTFQEHMKIFAIPASELTANENLVQNPGYGTSVAQ